MAYLSLFVVRLFIDRFVYLFIIERCTEGKLVTEWAKNLNHWVTSFRHWVTLVVVLKDALIGGGGIDRKTEGRERGWDSWGGAARPCPTRQKVGGAFSAVSSTPTAQKFSTIFSTQYGIS